MTQRELDTVIAIFGKYLDEMCDVCGNHRSTHKIENRCPEKKLTKILQAKQRKKELRK